MEVPRAAEGPNARATHSLDTRVPADLVGGQSLAVPSLCRAELAFL
jgi:hypothetical protein